MEDEEDNLGGEDGWAARSGWTAAVRLIGDAADAHEGPSARVWLVWMRLARQVREDPRWGPPEEASARRRTWACECGGTSWCASCGGKARRRAWLCQWQRREDEGGGELAFVAFGRLPSERGAAWTRVERGRPGEWLAGLCGSPSAAVQRVQRLDEGVGGARRASRLPSFEPRLAPPRSRSSLSTRLGTSSTDWSTGYVQGVALSYAYRCPCCPFPSPSLPTHLGARAQPLVS